MDRILFQVTTPGEKSRCWGRNGSSDIRAVEVEQVVDEIWISGVARARGSVMEKSGFRLSAEEMDRLSTAWLLERKAEITGPRFNAILCGLRLLQAELSETEDTHLTPDLVDILTNGEDVYPIGMDEIDQLCELINSGSHPVLIGVR